MQQNALVVFCTNLYCSHLIPHEFHAGTFIACYSFCRNYKSRPIRPKIRTPRLQTNCAPISNELCPSPQPIRKSLSPRPSTKLRSRSFHLSDDKDNGSSDNESLRSDSLTPREFQNELQGIIIILS